jgi:hypothetical protein
MGSNPAVDDDRVRRIVEECLEANDAGRAIDLGALCEHDPRLEERVRKLLAFEPLAESLLGVGREQREEVPHQLGPYVLKQRIGAGGMGQVFVAVEPGLGREVALKVLPSGAVESARFRREAAIAAALDHPNIVPIHAVGEDRGFIYIAMKRLSGPGLDALAAPLAAREAASIGSAIARALQFAHEAGVVHRDVKPANVVLDRGVPHLVDFGLARSSSFETMTAEGRILGTLPYMAPERLQGDGMEGGAGGDVYGLGAALYECVAGRPCFGARERGALLKQILLTEAPRMRLQGDDRGFEAIVLRALQKDPRRRFASAGHMAADLDAWLAGRPITSSHDGFLVRGWRRVRRHPRFALFAAALILVAVALGAALLLEAAKRRLAIESGVDRIDRLLRDDELLSAEEVLTTLASGSHQPPELRDAAARVDAAVAVEDLLDAMVGEGRQIGMSPSFVAAGMRPEVMQKVERTRDRYSDPTFATLALAHAALQIQDPALAVGYVEEVEAKSAPSRATLAIRAAAGGDRSWKAPAIATGSDVDHLFTAMVMRTLAAPHDELERELRAALDTNRAAVHYRAMLGRALLRSDQGRYDDALEICLSLDRPGHRRDAVDRLRAHLEIHLGDDAAAVAALDRIPPARRRAFDESVRIRILHKRGDQAAADAAWSAALDLWRDSAEIRLLKGYFAMENERFAEALAAFGDAAAIDGWYHHRETASAEVLQCRLRLAQERQPVDVETLERLAEDAAAARFRLPYAQSTALYVQSRVAEIAGETGVALARAREAAEVAPENALAALRVAHLAFTAVSAANPWKGNPLSPELRAQRLEGIASVERLLRFEGRRVTLPRGARARARYYESVLALAGADFARALEAATKGLEEPEGAGAEGAGVTRGLQWARERATRGAESRR